MVTLQAAEECSHRRLRRAPVPLDAERQNDMAGESGSTSRHVVVELVAEFVCVMFTSVQLVKALGAAGLPAVAGLVPGLAAVFE